MERGNKVIQNAKSGVDMQNNNYINVLVQSLHKKIKILEQVIEINATQKELINAEVFNADLFESSIKEKGILIEELDLLDTGFTEVYNRVKDDLVNHKEYYKTQIEELKALIQQITDKSIIIRVEEERTKALVAKKFALMKQDIKKRRVSNTVVNEYYKKMSKTDYIESQFVDKKK